MQDLIKVGVWIDRKAWHLAREHSVLNSGCVHPNAGSASEFMRDATYEKLRREGEKLSHLKDTK